MIEQTAESTFGSWSVPEVPLRIEYPLEVMDEIRAVVIENLQKLARGGLDAGGVLFGVRRDYGIRILTWRPIGCEHALGPTLQLSAYDRAGLAKLIESAPGDTDLAGLEPVGWFVSHTRSNLLLSSSDLEIFDSFFPEPWQVTLVLQPAQNGQSRAGFFVREANGQLKSDASYQDFEIKPMRRASRLAEIPISKPKERPNSRPEMPVMARIARTEHAAPMVFEPPRFHTFERPATHRRWLWMFPVILALITAGFLLKQKYLAPQNQPISLRVYDAGETVEIEWNQAAEPIRAAHVAVIDIRDSGETKRYSLSDEELHQGKMSYLRRGGDLELKMTVYPVGSTPVQEFAHFLEPGALPPPEIK